MDADERADAGFANPEVYEFLEAALIKYAIRLPANRVLQERIAAKRHFRAEPRLLRRRVRDDTSNCVARRVDAQSPV